MRPPPLPWPPKWVLGTLLVAGALLHICGNLVLSVAFERLRLPYNEQGRYFDERDSVVYHDHEAEAYLVLGAALALGGLGMCVPSYFVLKRRKAAADLAR